MKFQTFISASFCAFSIGTVVAWTTQLSPKLLNGDYGFPINTDELGWIGGLISLGAAILSLVIGFISTQIGCKITILLLIIPSVIGWAFLVWAQNIHMIYVGRILTGMVAGAYCVTTPLYCIGIAQKEIRGTLGSYTQLMLSSGILFDVIISRYVSIPAFTITCGIIPIAFGAIFVFMPQVPLDYLRKGKENNARKALKQLRARDYDINAEIVDLNKKLKEENQGNSIQIFKDSWKKESTRKAFTISSFLMIFRAFCGIDSITSYTSYIFLSTMPNFDPEIGAIIIISVEVLSALLQTMIVDYVGRRILLLISEIMMATSSTMVGISILLKTRGLLAEEYYIYINWLPLIGLSIFYIGYSLGLGPISFVMMAEINSPEVKNLVVSILTFIFWILATTVTKGFLVIKEKSGNDVVFLIMGACSFVAVGIMFFIIPETKGKSPEEIEQLLTKTKIVNDV